MSYPTQPQSGQQPPQSPPPPPPKQQHGRGKGLGIAALVLGILGLVFSWIPLVNIVGILLGLVALVLGGIGAFVSHRPLSIVGGVLGIAALVASVAVNASAFGGIDKAADGSGQPALSAQSSAPSPTSTEPPPEQATTQHAPRTEQQQADETAPEPEPETSSKIEEGTYVVGTDIEPGTYKTAGPGDLDLCYWARLANTSGELDSIIANGNPQGPTTVTISADDEAFETNGCQPWEKTG